MNTKLRAALVVLVLSVLALVPMFAATPITGTITLANGNRFNGKVVFTLSRPGTDLSTGTIVLSEPVSVNVSNGVLATGLTLVANDVITPRTYYWAQFVDVTGKTVKVAPYLVTGTSPWDLGTAVPTTITTNNISVTDLLGLRNMGLSGTLTAAVGVVTPSLANPSGPLTIGGTGATVNMAVLNGDRYVSKYSSLNAAMVAMTPGHILWVDSDITVTSPVTVLSGTMLACRPGVTITKGFNTDDMLYMQSNSVIANCKMNGAFQATWRLINASSISKFTISGNDMFNSGGGAIVSYSSSDGFISGNSFLGNTNHPIALRRGNTRIVITGNNVDCQGGQTNESDCIGVYSEVGYPGSTNVVISNNTMQAGFSDFCVEVGSFGGTTAPSHIIVSGNQCNALANNIHGGYSIADGTFDVSVTGNTYFANGFTNDIGGIEVTGSTANSTQLVTVSGNQIDAFGAGITVSHRVNDISIVGNGVRFSAGGGTPGININNSAAVNSVRVYINNNTIQANVSGGYGVVIQCNNAGATCADWAVKNNSIAGVDPTQGIGIYSVRLAGSMDRISVTNNTVNNLGAAYGVNSLGNTQWVGNTFTNCNATWSPVTPGANFLVDDVNGTTFAQLGAFSNGSRVYCSNCTVAAVCAGAGTGAVAKRLNAAWVCN